MTPQTIEGSWEEIRAHDSELSGHRVKLIILSEEPAALRPNEAMLQALRKAREIQRDMPMTQGSDSVALVREARSGAMYGSHNIE